MASGTISDFNGSFLDVNLAENSMLEAQKLRFDFLTVNAAGQSTLLMEDVSPLPAADVNLSGASSATLNMMDNSVLTGTATGTSSLGYYGTNVTDLVVTDLTSTVARLGDSRL